MSDFTVDKARITASFEVVEGRVTRIRLPDYVDNNGRPVYLSPEALAAAARGAIALWEANPQRQALAKILGVPPGQISDDDLRRAGSWTSSRHPNMQQIPRERRKRPT